MASAAQHLISVREVYPGSVAEPGAEFVELQLYAGGQQFVGGHEVRVYDQTGSVTGTYSFTAAVANGQSQRSILIATAAAQTQFGVSADLIAAAPGMSPAGGAACWDSFDCVSWGSFSGSLPSPAGSAAGAIPDGSSLVRSITRAGSQTSLDGSDDSNSSAADFAACSTPSPRNNSAAPGPQPCDGAGGGPDSDPPQTTIRGRPANRTRDRTPTLPIRLRRVRFEVPLQDRQCAVPLLPLAAHDQAPVLRPPHAEGPRDRPGGQPRPLAGSRHLQGRRALAMAQHVQAGDFEIWTEQVGEGPDVLLIGGLGDTVDAGTRGSAPLTSPASRGGSDRLLGRELALRHPELVRSLVLQSTWPVIGPLLSLLAPLRPRPRRGRTFRAGLPRVVLPLDQHGAGAQRRHRGPDHRGGARFSPQAIERRRKAIPRHLRRPRHTHRLPQITAPTLVLAGGRDPTSRPPLCQAVAELNPGAVFEVMEEEGHQPFQEVPDEWNARVDAFWQEGRVRSLTRGVAGVTRLRG